MTAATRTRHLSVQDLAERWNTTPKAIYNLNTRGAAPPRVRRNGGKRGPVLYRLADVEAFERSRLVTT